MLDAIFSNINWVDIVIVAVIGRCVYAGMKAGVVVEFFKLVGSLFATFIVLHYFLVFAHFLHDQVFIPPSFVGLSAFVLLWLAVVGIFRIIREGWMTVLKTEANPLVDKWGGAVLSAIRAVLVCGLLFLAFFLTDTIYISKTARNSFTGFYLMDVSPAVYNAAFEGIVVKFFPDEEMNETVFKLKDMGQKKKSSDGDKGRK